MKYLIFILIIFCNISYANYHLISEIQNDCKIITVCKSKCVGKDYIKVPMKYNCEFTDLVKEYQKDYDKPIETCTTDETTQEETCEITDYELSTTDFVWKIVPNAEKKAAYLQKELVDREAEAVIEIGRANRAATSKALDYIGGVFDSQPEEATDGLMIKYGEVYQALSQGRRGKALRLLNSITDAVDIEEQIRLKLIEILQR